MGCQGAPYLRFYSVFGIRVEKMQLEVLLQFFENKFYCPPVPVNQCDLLCRYLPIIRDEMTDSPFFILVSYPAQAKWFDFFPVPVPQMDMLCFYHARFFTLCPVFRRAFLRKADEQSKIRVVKTIRLPNQSSRLNRNLHIFRRLFCI
jgi:hypothetical protein